MKHLTALLVLLLVCSSAQTLRAQAPADSWVSVPLAGEGFTIEMPKNYAVKQTSTNFDEFELKGQIYKATSDDVDYTAWSFVNNGSLSKSPRDDEAYLDACADLVWESLLKPLRDQLPKKPEPVAFMSYQRGLKTIKLIPGREYAIKLNDRTGLTHFYVAGPNIYVLTVMNPQASFVGIQRFLNSPGLSGPTSPTPAASIKNPVIVPPAGAASATHIGSGSGGGIGPGSGGGIGPGRGGNVGGGDRNLAGAGPSSATAETDYTKVFIGRDVTQKARILSKPEPQYTESARKYSVTGTVVLRAVFSSSGQVTQIRAVSGLPHGLTARSIAAARNIRFTPAVKDGHNVSMWFQLEYNYNLY